MIFSEECRKIYLERMKEIGYTMLLNDYIESVFQDFERYLKIKRVYEDDIELIFKQNTSENNLHEIVTGIYSNKDISLKSIECQTKHDVTGMKTTSLTNKILGFDNIFFNSLLGLAPHCDFKYNDENVSQKKLQI